MQKRILISFFVVFFIAFHQICFANTVYSVDINDIDKKAVAEYLVRDLINDGYNILSTNENQVAVRRDVDDFWGQVFYGSRFNTVPEVRAYFNLVQIGADTQVTAEYRIVTNPNSGFEHYTVMNKKKIQEYLDTIKIYFNGYIGYGLSWETKKSDKCLKIGNVFPGGPADKANLKAGDMISKVQGYAVDEIKMDKINELFGEGTTGATLIVTIRTPVKDANVVLTKGLVPSLYQKPRTTALPNKAVFGFTNGALDLDGTIPVLSITPGSSAERAGLKTGDKIVSINGIPVAKYTPDSFRAAFDGGEGSKVELTLVGNEEHEEKTVVLVKTCLIQKSEL